MHKSSRNECNCAYPRPVVDSEDAADLTKRGAGVESTEERRIHMKTTNIVLGDTRHIVGADEEMETTLEKAGTYAETATEKGRN